MQHNTTEITSYMVFKQWLIPSTPFCGTIIIYVSRRLHMHKIQE